MKNETRRVLDENVNRVITFFKKPLVRVVNNINTTTILFFDAAFHSSFLAQLFLKGALDENVNHHVTLFKNPLVRVVNNINTITILFFGATFSLFVFGAAFFKRC